MPTGAEVIVAQLEDAGVEVCFGLPGVHNLPLWEALRESEIRLVGVRHEQAAAYAADGYARASGKLGVALTTTGPGAANTLGAVGEAWASRTPILVIATDIPSTLRRPGVYRGVLHETAGQAAMFAPVVMTAAVVASADELGEAVDRALRERRGPAYLEVPTDLLSAPATSARSGAATGTASAAGDDPYPLIDAAEHPLIWAGSGARDRADEVRALAERLAAPVLTTYGARGVLPPEHPCAVGLPPHVESAGRLWDEADLVIAFGSDLDGMNTQNWLQPQPPRLVAVNTDPADAAKNYRVDAVADSLDLDRIRQRDGDVGERLRDVRAAACRELDARALRFLDAVSYAAARGRQRRLRHVHPRLLDRRLPRLPPPAQAAVPDGLGDARLRVPRRARRVARRHRAHRLDLRRRRLPVRLRRARDDGAGAAPVHRGDRRRRRLRDAALRPAAGRRGALRRRPRDARLPRRSPRASASARRRSRASTTPSARRSRGTSPTPDRACSWRDAEALVPPPTTSPNWYRRRA